MGFRDSYRRRFACFALGVGAVLLAAAGIGRAQDKGEPGKFDFYLMNVAAPADFCRAPGAGPGCKPPRSFVLHGLWTQNHDGTYPVNCSDERGPVEYKRFLDLTPDLPLLQHEWEKHGTCTAVGPERFFKMEREAFHALKIPAQFKVVDADLNLNTEDVLAAFYKANPKAPRGGILLSCKENHLTAVEACFGKDLKMIRCQGLKSCAASAVMLQAVR